MRVVHLIDTLVRGGAQTLLLTYAEAAQARGLETTIVSLQPKEPGDPLPDILSNYGAQVIDLTIESLTDFSAIPQLVRLLRKERFDVMQTHLSHANILGAVAGQLAGVPVISTLHNTRLNQVGHYRIRQTLERIALQYGAHSTIAVGQKVAEAYRPKLGRQMIHIIPNAVKPIPALSPEERLAIRREIMGDPSLLLLIAVGRLTEQKGYPDLLEAFAQTIVRHPCSFLIIVGQGDLEQPLANQITKLGLTNHVRLLGHREDVSRLLAASDLYVSTAHWEGLSIAMLEAMDAGLPVVATNVGDAHSILSDSRGVLVEPGSPAAFSDQLAALLDHPDQMNLMGQAGRSYVENCFAPDPWLDKLLSVYRQACNHS